jgi:ABC-type nickel/cobalt efflux system permease component RcnA
MAAYLVGTRGTASHALFLGLTVTVSHTLGVLGLGLVTLYASHLITPERLYPWLGLVSGATVMAIGAWLLLGRVWRRRLTSSDQSRSVPDHHHGHGHGHSHSHLSRGSNTLSITWRNLAALGIAGGLLPSASALVILLAAISLHRIGFGLLLILAFSAGMAAVLAGIGLMLVYAGRVMERFQSQNRLVGAVSAALPVTTALVVLVSGLVVTARAAFQVGLL